MSLELAAVEVIWCEADEGGDLLAAHLPEFGQQGDERDGQPRAGAWHRGQQLIALSENNISGNHLGQALVEEADIGLQSHLAAFAEPPQHGIFEMSRWFPAATCSSHSWRRIVTISASLSTAASRCTTRVGIIATYSAISRASRRSFLASTPRARAN